jgi:hypothetical protein
LRRNIATVFQETLVLNRTIKENLMVGKLSATNDEIRLAADQAQALNFIDASKEGFDLNNLVPTTLGESILGKKNNSQKIINPETLQENIKSDFYPTSSKNPFSNVLQTDIKYDPDRKSAPPAFNPQVYDDITVSTKKMVQDLNPTILNTNKQLFGDLYEQFNLDQSNRIFFSTANTRVANDQGAFANYLYGDMPSCRNNDTLECVKDNFRYILY